MVATRKSINHIHYLLAADGSKIEAQADISNHCVDYFTVLLRDTVNQQLFEQEDINMLLPYRCTPTDVSDLQN